MPARQGPKKVNRSTLEMKRTPVRLSNAPATRFMDGPRRRTFFPRHACIACPTSAWKAFSSPPR